MVRVVEILSLLMVLVGAVGLWRPKGMVGAVASLGSLPRLYLAIGIRVVLGVALLWVASSSAFPRALDAIGWLSLLAAVAVLAIGASRLDAIVGWWSRRPDPLIRLGAGLAVGLGAFLIYAV